MISLLKKDTKTQFRIIKLLAWKEYAESVGNEWAARTASRHLMKLQNKTDV